MVIQPHLSGRASRDRQRETLPRADRHRWRASHATWPRSLGAARTAWRTTPSRQRSHPAALLSSAILRLH
jgi:hypothetical protein